MKDAAYKITLTAREKCVDIRITGPTGRKAFDRCTNLGAALAFLKEEIGDTESVDQNIRAMRRRKK